MNIKRPLLILTWIIVGLVLLAGIRDLYAANNRPLEPAMGKAKFAPDEVLVKFKGVKSNLGCGPSADQALMASLPGEAHGALRQIGGQIREAFPRIGLLRIQIPAPFSVGQAIESLYRSGTVEYAEPNYRIQLSATPSDPKFNEQWGLHNTGQDGGTVDADIDAPSAWDIRKYAGTILVALIDSGVDYNHEDLAPNMWKNPDEIPGNGIDDDANGYVDDVYGIDAWNIDTDPMDTLGHGTHCAGIIAAKGNNGKGMCGVAWTAKIMALRSTGYEAYGYTSQAVSCINYALAIRQRDGGRMVINASWRLERYSQSLYDAIKAAQDAGVLMVAATQNYTTDHDFYPIYPACYDLSNIISVGRSDRFDRPYYYGYGTSSVDLYAPGADIQSTLPGNAYGLKSGTSMACAHVTGAAALVWAHRPTSGWNVVKGLLLNGTENSKVAGAFKGKCVTEGRLNLNRSLATDLLDDPAIFSVTPNKAWVGDQITIQGVNFGSSGTLKFRGVDLPGGSISSWTNTKIVVIFPSGMPQGSGLLQVETAVGLSRGASFAHGKVEALVGHTAVPRYLTAWAQVDQDVWLIGGLTDWGITGLVERYNLKSNYGIVDTRWMMPTSAYGAGAAAIGSKVYVVGGYDNNTGEYIVALQIFDTATRTWSIGADLPNVLFMSAVVAYSGKLYVFGGAGGGISAAAYSYDPALDSWSTLANMPVATYGAATAPLGSTGKILVMGGGYGGYEKANVQEYDIATNTWSLAASLNKPRTGAAGISNGEKVFCLKGSTTNSDFLADSEWYHGGTWRNTLFGPQELYAPAAGIYLSRIFVLAGYDAQGNYSSNVWRFISP